MAALRAITGMTNGQTAELTGYYANNDFGAGNYPPDYVYSATSELTDNGGTIIEGGGAGRWLIQDAAVSTVGGKKRYNTKWFGVSDTVTDNNVRIERCCNYITTHLSHYNSEVYTPKGVYECSHRIFYNNNLNHLYNGMTLSGDGHSLPRLATNLTGSNNDLVWIEKRSIYTGTASVEYVDPSANNSPLSVTVSYPSKKLTVNLATDGSGNITTTANDIIAEVRRVRPQAPTRDNNPTLLMMVYTAPDNDGTGVVTAMSEANVVDNTANATIFKFSTEIPWYPAGHTYEGYQERVVLIRIGTGDSTQTKDVTLRDFEIDGNNTNVDSYNAEAMGALYSSLGYSNMVIENIYAHHIGAIGGPIANGISLGNGSILLQNCFSYHNWGGGFAQTSNATLTNPILWRNIHAYGNGLLFAARGINFSSSDYADVRDFTLVDNWSGWKSASAFGHYVMRDGIVLRELEPQEGEGIASWLLDHSGDPGPDSEWDIDRVIADAGGYSSIFNQYGRANVGRMVIRNGASGGVFRGSGSTWENLTVEDCGGSIASIRPSSLPTFKHLEIYRSSLRAIHNSAVIQSGHFEECNTSENSTGGGIYVTGTYYLHHCKFKNNTRRDIFGSGTLNYSDTLDFTESGLSESAQIDVSTVNVIAAIDYPTYLEWEDSGDVPSVPTRTSPTDTETGVSTDPTEFTWGAATGAESYDIQVSVNSDMSSPLIDAQGVIGTSYQTSQLSGSTTYYWRIRGRNQFGVSAWTSTWSFTTEAHSGVPGVPVLYSPFNGETGVARKPPFDWIASSGATDYSLEVSIYSNFSALVLDVSGITETVYTPSTDLAPLTVYYWRVRARNSEGYSNYTTTWSFTTTGEYQVLREISVISNEDDAWQSNGTIINAVGSTEIDDGVYLYTDQYNKTLRTKLTELDIELPTNMDGWVIYVRAKIEGEGMLLVRLYEGNTLIADWQLDDLTGNYVTRSLELTEEEAGDITDPNDLYLEREFTEPSS
jgi:hypothetical protein